MNRAYATLEVKAFEAGGKRLFSGVASTPNVDRQGDVIEPAGMDIAVPIPLLWQHDSREPIGWVRSAKVSKSGIVVECEVADVEDVGTLKARLDERWQMLKAGLVRGLSVGFRVIESARIEGTNGFRFIKTQLLELSAVTIPANQDCSLTAIKSADQAMRRAASGARPVVRLDTVPADSGNSLPGASGQQRRKGVVYLNP